MQCLQTTAGLSPTAAEATFKAQSEVISVLAELGAIILLFEIGLESNLKELIAVGIPATVVPCVGVAVPFALATAGLMITAACCRVRYRHPPNDFCARLASAKVVACRSKPTPLIYEQKNISAGKKLFLILE
ncbi:sodium/hydrogen exchanger [Microseira wollei NIES-4236]|uniref:Sodium/hydrogen exchanger n=1 Tax=Microseira wollei NIES-4236 TaxID=2530354 RepID=A0AAV3X6R5_9CYAN|nr:sodium/hydrogen exchanger [Microseira wollei NIES-4236]